MNIQIIRDENAGNFDGEDEKVLSDSHIIVQIYEIQTPREAELLIQLGVDHMGSVVVSKDSWKNQDIKEAIGLRNHTSVKSSLIPLYSDADMIFRTADYYQPDIMHFCEALIDINGIDPKITELIKIQEGFKHRFPEIKVMRSVPIAPPEMALKVPTLDLAKMFEASSDFFLTDTLLVDETQDKDLQQPETGFVGITGQICDWKMAKKLVNQSHIPVILAGGISPENVYEGIAAVTPYGVDSCTHTNALDPAGNSIRFKKDPDKIKKLVEETRRAEQEQMIAGKQSL